MGADGNKVQREGVIIINRNNFVNAMNLIDRVHRDGMMA